MDNVNFPKKVSRNHSKCGQNKKDNLIANYKSDMKDVSSMDDRDNKVPIKRKCLNVRSMSVEEKRNKYLNLLHL